MRVGRDHDSAGGADDLRCPRTDDLCRSAVQGAGGDLRPGAGVEQPGQRLAVGPEPGAALGVSDDDPVAAGADLVEGRENDVG